MTTTFRSVERRSSTRANILTLESLAIFFLEALALNFFVPYTNRRVALSFFTAIYLVRLNVMTRCFLLREISFEEITFVMLVWLPGIIASFTIGAAYAEEDLSPCLLLVSVIIYAIGSYLNTYSEMQRTWWKAGPENKGKCYTLGLFSLSRNINYLGDVILFSGWALVSYSWWNVWVPVVMGLSFYFHHIPDKEAYLAKRYSREWPSYVASTKSFVPFCF